MFIVTLQQNDIDIFHNELSAIKCPYFIELHFIKKVMCSSTRHTIQKKYYLTSFNQSYM